MKVRNLQLENEKLKSELKLREVEDDDGKRVEINLDDEMELLKELKENDEKNVMRIKELIKRRDELKKEELKRLKSKRDTSPINIKSKTTSFLRDNPYY